MNAGTVSNPRYELRLHERIFTSHDMHPGRAVAPKNKGRGEVKGISAKSRYRLVKLLAQINRPDAPLFVTLTYREFEEDWEVWKGHLRAFRNILERRFAALCGVWRLEFQQRGAPHYHILMWPGEEVDLGEFEAFCSCSWLRIIRQNTEANRKYGVTVEHVSDYRATAFYIGAYQSKDSNDRKDIKTGREWGVWHKSRLGLEPIAKHQINESQFTLFRRTVRRSYESFMRSHGKRPGRYRDALRRDQAFSSFLPFHAASSLVRWVAAQGVPVGPGPAVLPLP